MSPTASSKGALLLASLGALWLAGCARNESSTAAVGGTTRPLTGVGYVRMDDLVRRHPLYSQLARLDDDLEALQLKSVIAAAHGPTLPPDQLKKEQAAIQREFTVAADRAKATLKTKQDEYAKQESEAIREALGATGGTAGARSGAAIGADINQQLAAQARGANDAAQKNMAAYRQQLVAQDTASLRALQRSLNDSAGRSYRTKADQLQKQEGDAALQFAQDDSAERLSLRTKLSNLVLDDAAREDARKRLEALDRKESDALAALKNRDSVTLAALSKQLRDGTSAELGRQADAMKAVTLAKINKRELDLRRNLLAQMGSLPVASSNGGVAIPQNLPAATRERLAALHKKYQGEFSKDAKTTIDQFEKTRADLAQRLARLRGVDLGAQADSGQQLDALGKQRRDLYNQMVAQIGREVRIVAARRGVTVVFSDVMAPAGGIDLTADAEKDIESLHE
jgi:hypothetical protein